MCGEGYSPPSILKIIELQGKNLRENIDTQRERERNREKRYGGVVHMDTSVIGHLGMGAHMALCPPKHGEEDEEEIWALP